MTTYKKPIKRISLLEFRAWLQGVEELQPKDWSPTLDQWKLIRAKIDLVSLRETAPLQTTVTNTHTKPNIPTRTFIPPAPMIPSSIPSGEFIQTPQIPGLPPGIQLGADGKSMITPVGEVINGTFKSPFG